MTSLITDTWLDLAIKLGGDGLPVHKPWPSTVQAPALVIVPESPYVTAVPGSAIEVHLAVVVLVLKSRGLAALDDLIVRVIARAFDADWALTGVDSPAIPSDRPDVLATTIHIAQRIEF